MPLPAAAFIAPAAISAGVGLLNTAIGAFNSGKNYRLQKEHFEWQKEMQQEYWNREDNAVQRRVQDLKDAGLSPVLAAGSAAESGAPISATAPQRQMPDLSGLNVVKNYLDAVQQKRNIERTEAETEFVNERSSTERQNRDHQLAEFGLKQGYYKLDVERLALETQGMSLRQKQIAIELAKLGYEGERLKLETRRVSNDTKRVQNEVERIFNERDRIIIERNRSYVLNQLDAARKKLIDEQTLTERLAQAGVGWDTMQKILNYRVDLYDYLLSQNLGYRTKDTLQMLERINPARQRAALEAAGAAGGNMMKAERMVNQGMSSLRALIGDAKHW